MNQIVNSQIFLAYLVHIPVWYMVNYNYLNVGFVEDAQAVGEDKSPGSSAETKEMGGERVPAQALQDQFQVTPKDAA